LKLGRDVKEEVRRFVNAIIELSPSRNTISRLIMLLPAGEDEVEEVMPEVFEDFDYWGVLKSALGIERLYDGRLTCSGGGLSYIVRDFIASVFKVFRSEAARSALSALVGEILPNIEREWIEARVNMLLSDRRLGEAAKAALLALCERDSVSTEDLLKITGAGEDVVVRLVDRLVKLGLAEASDGRVSMPVELRENYRVYIKRLVSR